MSGSALSLEHQKGKKSDLGLALPHRKKNFVNSPLTSYFLSYQSEQLLIIFFNYLDHWLRYAGIKKKEVTQ